MKKISFLFLASLFSTSPSFSAETARVDLEPGRIGKVRVVTTNHDSPEWKKRVIVFIQNLHPECPAGVFFNVGTDNETLSLILAAKMSNMGTTLSFDKKNPSNWSGICALWEFDIN